MSRFMHNEPEVSSLSGDQKIFVAGSAGNKQISGANLPVSTAQQSAISSAQASILANPNLNTRAFLDSLPSFADQAAATAGGLTNGDYYRSGGTIKFVEIRLQDAAMFWLRGNEASGNLVDSTANGRNFSAVNAPTTETQGAYSGRLIVPASSHYFSLASGVPSINQTFHIAGHVYLKGSNGTHRGIICQGQTDGDDRALFFTISNGNQLRLHLSADGTSGTQTFVNYPGVFPTNEWVFVEGYYDTTLNEIGVAINGGLYETLPHAGGVNVQTTTDLEIGRVRFATNTHFDGVIRHLGMFNRRLFPEERQTLYSLGNPANFPFE